MSEPTGVPLPSSPPSRPPSHLDLEFDSGINTSAAWTVSLSHPTSPKNELISSLSDEGADDTGILDEQPDADQEPERPARVLYAFEGKPEFRELTNVAAGDELNIIRENVGEGWSLVRVVGSTQSDERVGEMGLLPRSYYIVSSYTFSLLHGLCLSNTSHSLRPISRRPKVWKYLALTFAQRAGEKLRILQSPPRDHPSERHPPSR